MTEIESKCDFRVSIPLTFVGWDDTGPIGEIIEWVNELVSWDDSKYFMRYRSGTTETYYLDVWFEEEQHAMWCSLRWL